MQQLTALLSLLVLASADAWGAPPAQQPPGNVRHVTLGELVHGVLSAGDEEFFDLTVPLDGILVVRLSWDLQRGSAGLTVEDRSVAVWETPRGSPITLKLPVVAGRTYRFSVWDPTWDYGYVVPFVITTAIEPTPPSGCSYIISLTGDYEDLGDPSELDLTSGSARGHLWLIAPAGCPWNAVSSAPFISFQPNWSDGVGTGGVIFSVAPNLTSNARSATIRIADQVVTVRQGKGAPLVDFNRDGHFDLVWHNRVTGLFATWLMNGTRFSEGVRFSPSQVPDTNWEPVGGGDLDGDGHDDLVWQNKADGRVSAWLMNGLQKVDAELLSIPQVSDLNWRVRAVADANGDGRADIFWQHQTRGLVAVWLMNGFDVLDGSLIQAPAITDLGLAPRRRGRWRRSHSPLAT